MRLAFPLSSSHLLQDDTGGPLCISASGFPPPPRGPASLLRLPALGWPHPGLLSAGLASCSGPPHPGALREPITRARCGSPSPGRVAGACHPGALREPVTLAGCGSPSPGRVAGAHLLAAPRAPRLLRVIHCPLVQAGPGARALLRAAQLCLPVGPPQSPAPGLESLPLLGFTRSLAVQAACSGASCWSM